LYVTVGSNSNVAENGLDKELQRACILKIDLQTRAVAVFASGLRNPNGLAWNPTSGELWTAVNERDEIGDLLVPDYITSVREGGFYGWPYSYFGSHVDTRVTPQNADLVAQAIAPDFAVGAHTASLGLAFYPKESPLVFPEHYRQGAFIGQHGSWNRSDFAGYKVVFVPFDDTGHALGPIEEFVTGFLDQDGKAMGRPVGVTIDKTGALLVADDVGNRIWRVAPAQTK
jgi:glucose/arabinose dehydrogenase